MADIPGTNVASMITPFTTEDIIATHSEIYGQGGYRSAANAKEMNAIIASRRKEGMIVHLLDEDKDYILKGGVFVEKSNKVVVDTALSTTSVNPVQNKVITNIINPINTAWTNRGKANGLLVLDSGALISAQYLPSYVDDVLDVYASYDSSASGELSNIKLYTDSAKTVPVVPESGKIYIDITSGKPPYQFRWSGTQYVSLSTGGLVLGTISGTAFDGGKGNELYLEYGGDNKINYGRAKRFFGEITPSAETYISGIARSITQNSISLALNLRNFAGVTSSQAVEFPAATSSTAGLMTAEDRRKIDGLDGNKYLRKDIDDTAEGRITFTKGAEMVGPLNAQNTTTMNLIVQQLATIHNMTVEDVATLMRTVVKDYISSERFVSGFAGEGMKLYKAVNGDWNLELDNITARKTFSVFRLVVDIITYQGGWVIHSPAGGKITSVADNGNSWVCGYNGLSIEANDQVICQTEHKRYWRLVTSVSGNTIEISKTDGDAGGGTPEVGDEIAVLGNRTNEARQSAQIDSSFGDDGPYRDDYVGINSYSLSGCMVSRLGNLKGITDPDVGALTGHGLFSSNVYLKGQFILRNGKTVEGAITDGVNTGISGIKIGGRNLILNSKEIIVQPESGNNYRQTRIYTFTEVGTYTFSADFEIYTGSSGTQGTALVYDVTNKRDMFSMTATSSERKSMTFTLSAVSNNIQLLLYAGIVGQTSGIGAKWKNVKLEKGNKATDWTPAPEDVENQITTIETRFEIREGQISSKVTEATTAATNSKKSETNAAASASSASSSATTATNKAGEAASSAASANTAKDNAQKILEDVTVKESSITQTASQITLQVSEVNKKVIEVNNSATSASTSATNAGKSATTATEKANAAAGSATNASNSANAAKGSADAAAEKLTVITQKESSINQTAEKITLQVKETSTYATSASTSATTATNKANEASTAATTATNKANAASGSASAAAGSATTAANQAAAAKASADTAAQKLVSVTEKETSINQTASQIALKVTEVTNRANEASASAELAAAMGQGRMLYTDPTFASGMNGVVKYANTNSSNVSVTRVNNVAGNPNDSGYCINITTTGATSPGFGGWSFSTPTKANRVLVCRFIAKIPSGRYLEFQSNSAGTGYTAKWLTKTSGTGDWTEYAIKVKAGSSGTFSTTMFFNLAGGSTPSASAPLTWYLSYATVYDLASSDFGSFVSKTIYDSEVKVLKDSINLKVSQTDYNKVGRLVATGTNLDIGDSGTGVTLNDTRIAHSGRGFNLYKIDKSSLSFSKVGAYDVWAGGSNWTNFVNALNAIDANYIVVVTSADSIAIDQATATAMEDYGATGMTQGQIRTSYVLIGQKGLGKGNGLEQYKRGTAGKVSISTTIINGTVTGFNMTGNIATSISSAQTQITQLSNSISLKADASTVNGINTRLQSAEAKIEPNQIRLTVRDQTTEIANNAAATAAKRTEITLDATGLDQSKYYPITIKLSTYVPRYTITVSRTLKAAYGKPSWSTHSQGFSLLCKWTTNANGWGTITVSRNIINVLYSFCNVVPIGSIGQMGNASYEYIYVRGGSKYFVIVEGQTGVNIALRTATFTADQQTIDIKTEVVTPVSDLSARPTEDTIKAQIVLDGFGVSVFGKKISFTGKVTFGSMAPDVQDKINANTAASSAAQKAADAAASTANTAKQNAQTAQNTADSAKSTADAAASSASNANNLLANIASDNKLTPSEKQEAKKEYDIIVSEKPKNDAAAVVYGIATTAYTSAYNDLVSYMSPLLQSLSVTSDIVGATFRSKFRAYYDARTDLLNAITKKAKEKADQAQADADAAQADADAAAKAAAEAKAAADAAREAAKDAMSKAQSAASDAANALASLTEIASDNVLSASEKQIVKLQWDSIVAEYPNIINQADRYWSDISQASYTNSYNNLKNYITPLLSSLTSSSSIVGTTFRNYFNTYYTNRGAILDLIAYYAKQKTDIANERANSAYADANAAQSTANAAQAAATEANRLATNAGSVASDAKTAADAAKSAADAATTKLTEIASDNKLTPSEKQQTKLEWDTIVAEKTKNDALADKYGVPKTAYGTAYSTLSSYITPLLSSLTTTSDIVGTTFRSNFTSYYSARTDLLNAISTAAKTLADAASKSAAQAKDKADYATAAAANVNTALTQLTGKMGDLAYKDMVSAALLDETIIEKGHIKTSLIDANAIVTGTLVAGVISTTNITTGKITITNDATIGGWKVKNNSLVIEGESDAKLAVEPNGGRFLRISSKVAVPLLDLRADGGTGLNIYTQQATGTCISIISQGGWAIKSTGPCIFNQRSGEDWSAPGVLWAARISDTGVIYTSWGNGLGPLTPIVTRMEKGVWQINHRLGHSQYTAVGNAIGDWGFIQIYMMEPQYIRVRLIHANNHTINAWFTVAIIGRPALN